MEDVSHCSEEKYWVGCETEAFIKSDVVPYSSRRIQSSLIAGPEEVSGTLSLRIPVIIHPKI